MDIYGLYMIIIPWVWSKIKDPEKLQNQPFSQGTCVGPRCFLTKPAIVLEDDRNALA